MQRSQLQALKRSQLQRLCKSNNLRPGGNRKTNELVDLLVAHYEQQGHLREGSVSSARSPGVQTATPAPSICSQDENQGVGERMSVAPINGSDTRSLGGREKSVIAMEEVGDQEVNITQTNSRITALETLCTRLLAQNTTSATVISTLQSRLDIAEQSINTLTLALDETRTQLATTNNHLRTLRSSLTASDQLAADSNTSFTEHLMSVRDSVLVVDGRLEGLEGKLQQLEEKVPRRTRMPSMEAPGSSSTWTRPHLSSSSSRHWLPKPSPKDDLYDSDPPSASSSKGRFGSVAPSHFGRSDVLGTATTSTSVKIEQYKSPSNLLPISDLQLGDRATPHFPMSSKAAGKRPASPLNLARYGIAEEEPAKKRQRSEAPEYRGSIVSPSLQSFSAGSSAGSPLISSRLHEPVTPPRRTTLLPPVEIVTTPSPPGRLYSSIRKESLIDRSHHFATIPRPPMDGGPTSPTTESPRRGMGRRTAVTLDSLARPPSLLYSTGASERKRKEKGSMRFGTTSPEPTSASASPLPLLIGKGRAAGARLDPETASAIKISRRTESIDEDGDTTMDTDAMTVERALQLHAGRTSEAPRGSSLFPFPSESSLSIASTITPALSREASSATVVADAPSSSSFGFFSKPTPEASTGLRFTRTTPSLGPALSLQSTDPPLRDYSADPNEIPNPEIQRDSMTPNTRGTSAQLASLHGTTPAKKRSFWSKWSKEESVVDDGWMKNWAR